MQHVLVSDVVETVTFETETETSSKTPRPRLQNLCILPNFSKKNVVITSELNFCQSSGVFPTCFGCFLPENTAKNKSLYYRNKKNISLQYSKSRDLKPWRPRPSLEIPSLVLVVLQ